MFHRRTKQRGVALIAMLAIVALGASYFIYNELNRASSSVLAERAARDAAVLARAKAALIGQVALNTASGTEVNPGRLPCPEALTDAGTANEGMPANASAGNPFGTCGPVAVGRLPWKALGIDKLVDSAAEPLWYAVGASWVPAGAATIVINSESPATGGLALSGTDAVAIIFAPGAPLPGQARSAINGATPPAVANYLDGENAAPLDATFVTGLTTTTFNDHSVAVTRAELLPVIEGAVADRFERTIAAGLRDAYSTAPWTVTPTLPFPAPFADPTTSTFKGNPAQTKGLLPVTYATTGACSPAPCTPAACNPLADTRCDPSFVTWVPGAVTVTSTSGATYQEHSCTVGGTPPVLSCAIRASTSLVGPRWMQFDMTIRAGNVAMALRRLNGTVPFTGVDSGVFNPPYGYTLNSAALNADGSATIALSSRVAAASANPLAVLGSLTCVLFFIPLCYEYNIAIPVAVLSDHTVVDPSNASTNWFYRNLWHQQVHYAAAPRVLPSQVAPRSCTSGAALPAGCLTANYLPTTAYSADSVRGLVLFAGQPLGAQVRPSVNPADWFEDANALAATPYTARAPTVFAPRSFNDRIVVVDHN